MLHSMKLMDHDQHVYCHKRLNMFNDVKDMDIFHIVLTVNTTYKTNKYWIHYLRLLVLLQQRWHCLWCLLIWSLGMPIILHKHFVAINSSSLKRLTLVDQGMNE
ncbi:hypothetical protein CR513_27216, partial [Mucuna pruriens]